MNERTHNVYYKSKCNLEIQITKFMFSHICLDEKSWSERTHSTLGNHSFHHIRRHIDYSELWFDLNLISVRTFHAIV